MTPEAKLTELVLYVGRRCALDAHGALKLNKILFYSDFLAYRRLGAPITGVEYRKYPHGPAPAIMKTLRAELHARGDAYEYEPLLSAEQIAVVDEVLEWIRPMTATRVSELSHPGWRFATLGKTIPYAAALLPDEPQLLTEDDERLIAEAARELSPCASAPLTSR